MVLGHLHIGSCAIPMYSVLAACINHFRRASTSSSTRRVSVGSQIFPSRLSRYLRNSSDLHLCHCCCSVEQNCDSGYPTLHTPCLDYVANKQFMRHSHAYRADG